MTRSKIGFAALILGSVLAWNSLAQAPAPPVAAQPAATTPAPQPADAAPIGSVATLQGSATVLRNNAPKPLALRSEIFKGDVLQTGADGTLGVTFVDDTTFTLKPNSSIDVDDYVYQEGGSHNAALFDVARGTVAFLAAKVAHTGDMKIDTPTSTLGIRGTTGLIDVPAGATPGTTGEVTIKLYPDANGAVGRIQVFDRAGVSLGILDRAATGFAIRAGAPGAARFAAIPLTISPQEADRDRLFVRQAFTTQFRGRQFNIQRNFFQRNQLQRQNLQRPNFQRLQQLQHGNQLPGNIKPNVVTPRIRTRVPIH